MKCKKCGCEKFKCYRQVDQLVLIDGDENVLEVLESTPHHIWDDEFICAECGEVYDWDELNEF